MIMGAKRKKKRRREGGEGVKARRK